MTKCRHTHTYRCTMYRNRQVCKKSRFGEVKGAQVSQARHRDVKVGWGLGDLRCEFRREVRFERGGARRARKR